MKTNRSIILNCGLSLVFFLFAAEAARVEAADVRGKITQINAMPNARVAATVQIEGKIEKDTQFDKASVRILPGTRISRLQGGKPVKADVPDLKVGQTVEASFAGPVAESYPVQATANEILILAEADKPADKPRPDTDPQIKEGSEVTITGTLKGGMMGIGGETTGWLLVYKTAKGQQSIEVDFSGMDDDKIAEGGVRVAGKIIKRDYVERGPTLILRAKKLEPVMPPADRRPPSTQAEAMAIQNRYTDRLMNIPGVVGVGLGQNARGQFTIHVMVKDAAAAKNPQIPKELEGMPVETEITGEIKAY